MPYTSIAMYLFSFNFYYFLACVSLGVILTNTYFMKYFNKTRTIEDKVNNRDLLKILQEQNQLLKQILSTLEGNQSKAV